MNDELRPGLSMYDDNNDKVPDTSGYVNPYSSDEGINIGFIGFPRSGKTMTMLTLDKAMIKSRWQIKPDDTKTLDYLESLNNRYMIFGKFPPASGGMSRLSFSVERKGDKLGFINGTWPPIKLEVLDAPGSAYLPGGLVTQYDAEGLKYIANCSGIVFLIDPKEIWHQPEIWKGEGMFDEATLAELNELDDEELQNVWKGFYFNTFNAIFDRIRLFREEQGVKLPTKGVYIAFCLSKMDLFSTEKQDLKGFAETIIGTLAIQKIDQFCKDSNTHGRWFSTSAIGVRLDEQENKIVSRFDPKTKRIIKAANIQPEGIRDALEWLLDGIHDDLNRGNFLARWRARFR